MATFDESDFALAQAGLRGGAVLDAPGGKGRPGRKRGAAGVLPDQCAPMVFALVTLVRGATYYVLGLWAMPRSWWPPLAADALARLYRDMDIDSESKPSGSIAASDGSDLAPPAMPAEPSAGEHQPFSSAGSAYSGSGSAASGTDLS